MGYIRHHAIVVTDQLGDDIMEAHRQAQRIGLGVTPIADSEMNGTSSFLVVPDGSKEGWATSEEGDERRETFKRWLKAPPPPEGDGPQFSLDWIEVQYGDDEGVSAITDHSGETTA